MASSGMGAMMTAHYFMQKERKRIDALLRRQRSRLARKARRVARDEQALSQQVDEVEADLGRTLLLAFSVNRLLVRKKIVSPQDVMRIARDVDRRDGQADGRADPALMRPPNEAAKQPPPTPGAFLRQLEREEDA